MVANPAPTTWTIGITVPANGTIDVVVHAIDVAPMGVGPYRLTCAMQ
jgi:hypothetical protein